MLSDCAVVVFAVAVFLLWYDISAHCVHATVDMNVRLSALERGMRGIASLEREL